MTTLFTRWYADPFRKKVERPFVHMLFGARQTGKSTLVRQSLPHIDLLINLADPDDRTRFQSRPGDFMKVCQALPRKRAPAVVFVDEAQLVPALFDAVQTLYDGDKTRWRFVLCGSSARRLRQTGANLLPGRSFLHHLFPLTLAERPSDERREAIETPGIPGLLAKKHVKPFPTADLITRLVWGELPGIVTAAVEDREDLLRSYVALYLEEEVRRETALRDWGAFLRFVQLAAIESGQTINFSAISKEAGVSLPTVRNYYQLLEDMFVGFQIPAFSGSARKNLLSTPRFCFFDVGVRHAAARLKTGESTVMANPGPVFEQWVGIELWKRLQYLRTGRLSYYRTSDGREIDFIVETDEALIPIEVKWTENPSSTDARGLRSFLADQGGRASHGYIVCRCRRPMQIAENITAIPWFCL